jgi:hypothetical protein
VGVAVVIEIISSVVVADHEMALEGECEVLADVAVGPPRLLVWNETVIVDLSIADGELEAAFEVVSSAPADGGCGVEDVDW